MSSGHGKSDERPASVPDDLPAVDFTTFVLSLSHSARLHLGDAPDPVTGKSDVDLPMARHSIDLLALLLEKTRGNLTGAEERVLTQELDDLRVRFVEVSRSRK
ncbi:MAG TPA: DUF1844 domain-containing protein [Polyangiaceae bacterium]|nr:DUF1844 domain-containing protein [Polyangiaceae bacterium]